MKQRFTRRSVLRGAGAMLATGAPMTALAQEAAPETPAPEALPPVRRNASSFRPQDWQDHFEDLKHGAILCDTTSRMLQYWSEDQSVYKLYPTSVPMSEELTKLGVTRITFKDEAPDWAPTPSMIERDPTLPRWMGPGPDNPLGVRALHLTWQYYRIHGTNDTRKIGRRSSNGCIGLYNEQIVELFGLAKVGTQVKII